MYRIGKPFMVRTILVHFDQIKIQILNLHHTMCYKILKATQVCELGHVLERRVCWRQCSRITNLNINGPEIRCRDFVSAPDHDTWPIIIDNILNTPLVHFSSCVLCTPELNDDYKVKQTLWEASNRVVATATGGLQEAIDDAETMGWEHEYVRTVRHSQDFLDAALQASNLADQERVMALQQVQNMVQDNIGLGEETLDSHSPVFYYGPTDPSERNYPGLNSNGRQFFDASEYPEYIIDWLVVSHGTRGISLWDFDDV